MQLIRPKWTLGLLVVLGLASVGVGCGSGSDAITPEKSIQIRESKKAAHQAQADLKRQQGAPRKGARRGPDGS
jgi:hypothetical protein